MKALEDKIVSEGKILEGDVLKVGSFLNQKIDTSFTMEMAKEIVRLYSGERVTKVVTMESSGIAIGFAVAFLLSVPLVFAKKSKASNQNGATLQAPVHSYTHDNDYVATVAAEYVDSADSVLIVDDFLANGEALRGLIKIVHDAGARVAGCAIEIEKGFQGGGDELRAEGVRIESLAIIESMSRAEGIRFRL